MLSNAVDPGWVPTKMGGAGAPDDLEMGHLTQTWLAVSDDPAAKVSGGYWHHRKRKTPAAEALDPDFQERLIEKLAELTGTALFKALHPPALNSKTRTDPDQPGNSLPMRLALSDGQRVSDPSELLSYLGRKSGGRRTDTSDFASAAEVVGTMQGYVSGGLLPSRTA